MSKFQTIRTTVQLAVGTVLLALVLRTWLVMGLVEPVTVAGSSMAPALRGGDHLWIDRTRFDTRRPRRGEVAVLRNPHDGSQLCVKRIVGLPGETVELVTGDVWIDGRPWVKTLAQQRAVRQLVHREAKQSLRWQAEASKNWRWNEDAWRLDPDQENQWHWLRYAHHNGQPITDDVAHNLGLSRRLNVVGDFSLSAMLQVRGSGRLGLEVNDGRQTLRVVLAMPEGKLSLTADQRPLRTTLLSPESLRELARGAVLVELSNFDRQLLLAIGSRVEVRHPLNDGSPPPGTSRPFAVGAAGLQIELGRLTVYRDIFYSQNAVGEVHDAESAVLRLGDDEYYLLGDNSPISLDSRGWGGVSGRLLLGRPLGVR